MTAIQLKKLFFVIKSSIVWNIPLILIIFYETLENCFITDHLDLDLD